MENEGVAVEEMESIQVESCSTAILHAAVPWHEMAEVQLGFSYVLAVAMQFRKMAMQYSVPGQPNDTVTNRVCGRLTKAALVIMDAAYAALRPAGWGTVSARRQGYASDLTEVEGGPTQVAADAEVNVKFRSVAAPVLGTESPGRFAGKFLEH